MGKPEPHTELNTHTARRSDDYEPYGDEWRKEVMKLTKLQIIEMLRDECLERRQPVVYPGLK